MKQNLLTPEIITAISLGSLAMLLISLVIIPFMLVNLPADYFTKERLPLWQRCKQGNAWQLVITIAKNLLGLSLLIAGILMLFLPGQGLLTIFAALVLLDYPKKYQIESAIVHRPSISQAINWLRKKAGKQPLEF